VIHIRTLIAFLLLLPLPEAYASDWKVIGASQVDKETVEVLFFDAESVKQQDDTVRVWVEGVPKKTLGDIFNQKHNEKLIEAVASKLVTGYVPPYVMLQSLKGKYSNTKVFDDDRLDVMSEEVIVNIMDVRITSKIYYEIDCKEERIAPLSVILYRKDGSLKQSSDSHSPKYSYIVPDSNGERLSQVLSPKR